MSPQTFHLVFPPCKPSSPIKLCDGLNGPWFEGLKVAPTLLFDPLLDLLLLAGAAGAAAAVAAAAAAASHQMHSGARADGLRVQPEGPLAVLLLLVVTMVVVTVVVVR